MPSAILNARSACSCVTIARDSVVPTFSPCEEEEHAIASFADLDAFQGKDIESACGIAWDYLAKEEPAPADDALATKRGKLIDRTKSLITGLHAVEKLSDLDADKLSCGGHADGTADKKADTKDDAKPADDKTDDPATDPPADVPADPPAAGDDDDTKP